MRIYLSVYNSIIQSNNYFFTPSLNRTKVDWTKMHVTHTDYAVTVKVSGREYITLDTMNVLLPNQKFLEVTDYPNLELGLESCVH